MVNNFIHIFTAGTYPQFDPAEQKTVNVTVSEDDIKQIAFSYDPLYHEAPLWIGHPNPDAPALGWFSELKADGIKLFGKLAEVSDELVDLISKKKYKKVSVEIYRWIKGETETLYLGAVGLTNLPLVKSLPPLHLDGKEGVLSFSVVNSPDLKFHNLNNIIIMNKAIEKFAASMGINITEFNSDEAVLEYAAGEIKKLQDKFSDDPNVVTSLNISVYKASQFIDEHKSLSERVSALTKEKAEIVVNAAVDSGKILPAQKESYMMLAETNLEAVQTLFATMSSHQIFKPNQVPNTNPPAATAPASGKFQIPEDRKSWSYRDWEIKDPKGLLKMKNDDPDKFSELQDAFYNS